MKNLKTKTLFDFRTLSMIMILLVMWIFFRIIVGDFYFSGESISKLSRDMVSWTILAAGVTLIIVSGNIDLSVGSLLALVTSCCALLINPDYGFGMRAEYAVPIAIFIGAVAGLLQGTLVAYFKIPSFIVTLGGFFIFRGITQKISEFDPRVPDESWVVSLGFDYVPAETGWLIGIIVFLLIAAGLVLNKNKRTKAGIDSEPAVIFIGKILIIGILLLGFVFKANEYKGIPNQTIVMALVLFILHIIMTRTRFGRHLYAIGGNSEASRLSGVKIEKNIVSAFVIMGILSGIAGVIWMAQNQGSTKNAGQFYELYAIAGAVIGGTSLLGGRGSIFGTFLGGLVMATVIQGMDYSNLDNWLQLVVRGSVLVFAVGIDIASKNPPFWMVKFKLHAKNRLNKFR